MTRPCKAFHKERTRLVATPGTEYSCTFAANRRFISLRGDHMDHSLVTTAFELPGHAVTRTLGLIRGITVRSRSVFGNIGADIQSFFGGNITLYTELCEHARIEAYEVMIQHATAVGANAIIGVRYDATEISPGITEVLCYGTAVTVQAV
jgi:uncharacterized protein YbjQ (UPF0145 family)